MLDVLEGLAGNLRTALFALLDGSVLHDVNADNDGGLTIVGACNFWSDLAPDAAPLLRVAQEALAIWSELTVAAVAANDKYRTDEFKSSLQVFDGIVDRSERASGLWESTVDEVRESAAASLDDQLAILRILGSGGSSAMQWLPDTGRRGG